MTRRSRPFGTKRALGAGLALLVAFVALGACKKKPPPVTIGSVTLPAAVASALPLDPREVSKVVNPNNEPPYSGPTGIIRGVVSASGDPAPVMNEILARIPPECSQGRDTYGKLFREGMMRSLADVVVGVTGYQGYVPAEHSVQSTDIHACSFGARTFMLTFGQRLDVSSKDNLSYVPNLLGAGMPAELVAVPHGAPVQLWPQHVGRYQLTDSMRLFMQADVIVVKFSTHDVSGLDGHYAIHHVPVGKVKVSALLPATMAQVEKDVELHAGETLDVNFELPFDRAKWDAARDGRSAPSSASPRPAKP